MANKAHSCCKDYFLKRELAGRSARPTQAQAIPYRPLQPTQASVVESGAMAPTLLSDLALARRLERTEGTANARFVEARARVAPETGARWMEVAGAYAMFDGVASPCTQTFGLGLFQMPTAAEMDAIEAFFREREAPVIHEVSPLADAEILPLLSGRGYHPVELTTVMFLELREWEKPGAQDRSAVKVRAIGEAERAVWARTSAAGWSESAELAAMMEGFGKVAAATEGNVPFLAELDGQPIATGGLAVHGGLALFAGASTIPQWRRRGAQQALLEHRFHYAQDAGCDLAMMCTAPGSASQRNAERQGFRIAYTRIKWGLREG